MPQLIDIPNQGVVAFPDSMGEAEIKNVIKRKFYSSPAARPGPALLSPSHDEEDYVEPPSEEQLQQRMGDVVTGLGVMDAAENAFRDVLTNPAAAQASQMGQWRNERIRARDIEKGVTAQDKAVDAFFSVLGSPAVAEASEMGQAANEAERVAGRTQTAFGKVSPIAKLRDTLGQYNYTADPFKVVINSVQAWGKLIAAGTADIFQEVGERPISQGPAAVMDVLGGKTPNVQALSGEPLSEPLPVQRELKAIPGTAAAIASAGLGTLRSAPTLGAGMLISRIRPDLAPMVFGGLFGYEAAIEGGSPADVAKATLTGLVIPGTMHMGGQAMAELSARMGVMAPAAQKALEIFGGQVALNTLTHISNLPEYIQATPEERKRMAIEMTAGNLFFILMDAGKLDPRIPSMLQQKPDLVVRLAETAYDRALKSPQWKAEQEKVARLGGEPIREIAPPPGQVSEEPARLRAEDQANIGVQMAIMETEKVAPLTAAALRTQAAAPPPVPAAIPTTEQQKGAPSAPTGIRKDTGLPGAQGEITKGSEADRRQPLEQKASQQPEPVAAGEQGQAQVPARAVGVEPETPPDIQNVRPAIRMQDGTIIPGEKFSSHDETIAANKIDATQMDRRTYVDVTTGQEVPAETLAKMGLPTAVDTEDPNRVDRVHSDTLTEWQKKALAEAEKKAKPAPGAPEAPKVDEAAILSAIEDRIQEFGDLYRAEPDKLRQLVDNTVQEQIREDASGAWSKWASSIPSQELVDKSDAIFKKAGESIVKKVQDRFQAEADARQAEADKRQAEWRASVQKTIAEEAEREKRKKEEADWATTEREISKEFGGGFKDADTYLSNLKKELERAKSKREISPISGKEYWPEAYQKLAAKIQERIDRLPADLDKVAQTLSWSKIERPAKLTLTSETTTKEPPPAAPVPEAKPWNETANRRVVSKAYVVNTGYALGGPVAWESPFIIFRLPDGREFKWHSNQVESLARKFGFPNMQKMRGQWIDLDATVRPTGRVARMNKLAPYEATQKATTTAEPPTPPAEQPAVEGVREGGETKTAEAAKPTFTSATPRAGELIGSLKSDQSGTYSPKRTLLYQQLGVEVVPGIRLGDAEDAGRLYELLSKGEATQAEWDKWVADAKASGRVSGESQPLPKFAEGDKVMVGEGGMAREGVVTAGGPRAGNFVRTNLGEQFYEAKDIRAVEPEKPVAAPAESAKITPEAAQEPISVRTAGEPASIDERPGSEMTLGEKAPGAAELQAAVEAAKSNLNKSRSKLLRLVESKNREGAKIAKAELGQARAALSQAKENLKQFKAAQPSTKRKAPTVTRKITADVGGERPPDIIDELGPTKINIDSAKGFIEDIETYVKKSSVLRKLFVRQGGRNADDVLDGLRREGKYQNDDETMFLERILGAADVRRGERKAKTAEQTVIDDALAREQDFREVALENKRPPSRADKVEKISVDNLLEGEEFMLDGVKVKVKELVFDDETTELAYVVLEDGRRFDTQTIGAGEKIFIDEGTLKKKAVSAEEAWNVPAEEPKAEPTKPAAPARKAPGELFAAAEIPFNLMGETQRTGPSKQAAAEAGQEDLLGAKPKAEQKVPEARKVQERNLTKDEQREFAELTRKLRKEREAGGEPLTTEETQRYQYLLDLAGQKAFGFSEPAGLEAIKGKIKVLSSQIRAMDENQPSGYGKRAKEWRERRQQLDTEMRQLRDQLTEGQGRIVHVSPITESPSGYFDQREYRVRQLTDEEVMDRFPSAESRMTLFKQAGTRPFVGESRKNTYEDAIGNNLVQRGLWYADSYAKTEQEAITEARDSKRGGWENVPEQPSLLPQGPGARTGRPRTEFQPSSVEAPIEETQTDPLPAPAAPSIEPAKEVPESREGTGLKNQVARDEMRQIFGQELSESETRAMMPVWEEAGRVLQSTPTRGEELVDVLRENPNMGLSDVDSAVLLRYKVGLLNSLNDAAERTITGRDTPEGRAAQAQYITRSAALREFLELIRQRGTSWGREGRWRQAMAREDYSFATMEARLVAARGGKALESEERVKLEEDMKRLQEAAAEETRLRSERERQLQEAEAQLEYAAREREILREQARELEGRIPRIAPTVFRVAERIVSQWEESARRAEAELNDLWGQPGAMSGPLDPNVLDRLIIIGAARLSRGVLNAAEFGAEMLARFGDRIRPYLEGERLYNEAFAAVEASTLREEAAEVAAQPVERTIRERRQRRQEGESRIETTVQRITDLIGNNEEEKVYGEVQKLLREFVQQGLRGWRPVADAIHRTLIGNEDFMRLRPDWDFGDTLTAMSGIGRFKALATDELSIARRQARAEAREVQKIRLVIAREPVPRTGMEMPTPSDAQRRLTQVYDEMKKRYGLVVTDPATQLRSVLQARKRYYDNRISDLQWEIQNRQKIVRNRTAPPTDPDLEAKISEYRQLKEERDSIFASEITEEERIRRAILAAERNQEAWTQKLIDARRGVFDAQTGRRRPATSPELDSIRDLTESMKSEVELLKDLDGAYQEQKRAAGIQNDIAEYERRLAAGEYFQPEKMAKATTPMLEQLVQRRAQAIAALRAARDASPEMMQRALEEAQAYGNELERRINEGDIAVREKKADAPTTPQLEAQRAENAEMQKIIGKLRSAAKPKKDPRDIALKAMETRLLKSIADYSDRLARKDFTPRPKREPVQPNKRIQELRVEQEKIKQTWRAKEREYQLQNRHTWERIFDFVGKYRRFAVLSSPVVIPKLISAGMQRIALMPLEDMVAHAWKTIPAIRRIAEMAPTEGGGFSLTRERKAAKTAFGKQTTSAGKEYRKALKAAADVLKTGHSELDLLYGGSKHSYTGESALGSRWLEFAGQLHGMLKAPVKQLAFERAVDQLTEFYTKKLGREAVEDEFFKIKIGLEAYKVANRSIFLNDNKFASAVQGLFRLNKGKEALHSTLGEKLWATTGKVLLPIVRVPTNIVAETMQYAAGWASAPIRAAFAIRKGVENLKPDEADIIMRELRKGSVGAAALALGFFSPNAVGGYYQPGEKRREGEVKPLHVKLFGHDIPSFLMHNPLLQTIQLGATIRRVADSKLRKRDQLPQGIPMGVLAGALGLVEEVPFVREMYELEKLADPFQRGKAWGELGKSMVVPAAVSKVAEWMDPSKYKRKPGTMMEYIKSGIPVARETVPVDYKKKAERPWAVKQIVPDNP